MRYNTNSYRQFVSINIKKDPFFFIPNYVVLFYFTVLSMNRKDAKKLDSESVSSLASEAIFVAVLQFDRNYLYLSISSCKLLYAAQALSIMRDISSVT